MPMGCSRTQNRPFGRSRSKADLGTRQRSAPLRRMSSAEAALTQAMFGAPSSALIRTSFFGDSDVVARLRSNSSRRESMAAPPKMETDDADKEGEGATRERSTSVAVTDGAAWVLKKGDMLSKEQPPLVLQPKPLVLQPLQEASEQALGVPQEALRVDETLAPSPLPQEIIQEGADHEGGAVWPQELRGAEGADMAGGQDEFLHRA